MSGSKPTIYKQVLQNTGLNAATFPTMTKWLEWLMCQVSTLTYLEIGVLYGGTFEKVVSRLRNSDYAIGIDLFEGYPGHTRKQTHGGRYASRADVIRRIKESGYHDFELIKGDSNLVVPTLGHMDACYAYIDGNHTFEACRDDLHHVYDKVERGIFQMHDSQRSEWGVARVIKQIVPRLRLTLVDKTHDTHFFRKGFEEGFDEEEIEKIRS